MDKERKDLVDISVKIGNRPAVRFEACDLQDFSVIGMCETFFDYTRQDCKANTTSLPAFCIIRFNCRGEVEEEEGEDPERELSVAKSVVSVHTVAGRTIGYCPSCGRGLDSYHDGNGGDHITKFCYNCGQKVKWN